MKRLDNILKDKTPEERASLKAKEVAKVAFRGKYQKKGIKVEILDIQEIPSGVSVKARGWKGNKQLGFGKDGSVDIERFNVYNPPILVDDPRGTILRETLDSVTGKIKVRRLREDHEGAVREVTLHNVQMMGKEDTQIQYGKVGNTVSTFYPEGDNSVYYSGNTTWATFHDASSGNGNRGNTATMLYCFVRMRTTGNMELMERAFFSFDTSALDSDTVDSATVSFYGDGSKNTVASGWINEISLCEFTGSATTSFGNTDYDQRATTKLATNLAISAWSTSAYNDFTLNASGISAIDTSGSTKYALIQENDRADTEPTNQGTDQISSVNVKAVDTSGTASDPKLVVTHSSAAAESNALSMSNF